MPNIWLAMMFYFIPILLLFGMALEVYNQNRQEEINKIAASFMFVTIILYMGTFARHLNMPTSAKSIALGLTYLIGFILICLVMHFCLRLTGRFKALSRKHVMLICYGSLVPDLLVFMPSSWLSVYEADGIQVYEISNDVFQLLMIGNCLYSIVICMIVTIMGFRYTKHVELQIKRKQFRTIMLGCLVSYAWSFPFIMNDRSFLLLEELDFSDLGILSTLWIALFLRYAMMKYNFIPTIPYNDQILYELSPLSILIVNQQGIIKDLNPQTALLLEYPPSELMFRPIGQFLISDHTVITRTGSRKEVKVERQYMESRGEILQYMVITDVSKGREAEDKVKYLASHDSLTGLSNRFYFQKQVEAYIHQVDGGKAVIFVLDIDKCKQISLTESNVLGDRLLQYAAKSLKSVSPSEALISRLGENEFALIVPDMEDRASIDSLANRIMNTFKETFVYEGNPINITVSMGICLTPEHGEHADELLQYAEMAMYEARRQGNNHFVIFKPSLRREEQAHYCMNLSVRKGLEEGEFSLHYQPQLELGTSRIIGVEALIRWIRPGIGLLAAEDFIPMAEESGNMMDIDYWVLDTACRQLQSWMQEGLDGILMSIHLSPRQLSNAEFPEKVSETIRRTGILPGQLCLEIKEHRGIYQNEEVVGICHAIQSLGVKLSIDDFRTGYSSLPFLKRIAVHSVKIDRSFVKDMLHSAHDEAIVHTMIDVSHSLGKRVIAEGVEAFEQWEKLSEFGCDEIQGYFLSKPLEANDFLRFMAQKTTVI
ncbi:GGDEF and EAL domain-containing protein [Paenibacillus sp. N3.4]|uniref:GGDEF and EAL domain-containing protein n=1 Tax=Paenibacillus sp. N3.4 TaxID=2603222 RepID=UPI0016500312|nr:GGDEF and EAL domain-containing protein [Paenibacillus sp. N3.4]